jgi:hypothetical protein
MCVNVRSGYDKQTFRKIRVAKRTEIYVKKHHTVVKQA